MKARKAVTLMSMTVLVLITAASALAQEKPRFGERIDPRAPKVTLAELLKTPDAYAGKKVVVDGTFAGMCADGADFYFKDKFDLIEAEPPQPEVYQLQKGTRVRLFGIVKVRHRGSAQAGEKQEAGEAEVRIVAKGVEVQ